MSGSCATQQGAVAKPCVKDINLHRGGHDRTSEAADLKQSLHIPGICAFFFLPPRGERCERAPWTPAEAMGAASESIFEVHFTVNPQQNP